MKPILLAAIFTLATLATLPMAQAYDGHALFDHDTDRGTLRALRAELQHTRGTYNHVLDELDTYGTSRSVRREMRHIDEEIDHVSDELAEGVYDPCHIRAEVAHIHEQLHQISAELHARNEDYTPRRRATIPLPFL